MTLEQKIGQVLCVGYQEDYASAGIRELVAKHYIGGLCLFGRNYRDLNSMRQDLEDLQDEAIRASGVPLLIGVDQEGGTVNRFSGELTHFPGAMAQAATGDAQTAYEIGRAKGAELLALGINVNFAPVLDINTNADNPVIGVRSYGGDRETVAAYASAYARGLQESGVLATGKHFPGHGDTYLDSHFTLPKVDHPRERLEGEELYPFKVLIDQGIGLIMTTHIIFPAFDPSGVPATLSRPVLTELLRERMGFSGIIITDCMEMKAIADFYGTAQAAKMALDAGADMILVCHTRDVQLECIRVLKEACLQDAALMAKLDRAVERLIRAKSAMPRTLGDMGVIGSTDIIGSDAHTALAARVGRDCLTMHRGSIPVFKKDEAFAAVFFGSGSTLERRFGAYYTNAEIFSLPMNPSAADKDGLLERIAKYDSVIIFSRDAIFAEIQGETVREILKIRPGAAVVATGSPYDLQRFPAALNYVCAYERTFHVADGILAMLKGEFTPHASDVLRK